MNKLLSVIVPVYNVEKYLCRCLDSIIAQDYSPMEIILVDDGSPDNCGAICDEYTQKYKFIKNIHKENGGLSSARNAGLDVAKGEYISFIDSDDSILPGMYSEMIHKLEGNNLDMISCEPQIIKNGKIKKKHVNGSLVIYNTREGVIDCLANNGSFVASKIYRRTAIGNIRFPEGRVYEDVAIMWRFIANCKRIGYWDKIFYNYYFNSDSISKNSLDPKKRWDFVTARKEAFEYSVDNRLPCTLICKSLYIRSLVYCLTAIYAVGTSQDKRLYLPMIHSEILKYRDSTSYIKLNPKYKLFLFLYGRFDGFQIISAKISLLSKKVKKLLKI